jgi:retron-type reverse transcriptase
MHENRETSVAPEEVTGRSGKATSHNPDMHAAEESDFGVVPMNQPNKGGPPPEEVGEGRPKVKENIAQPRTRPTQSGGSVSQGLSGVHQRARERKQEQFTALLHHLTVGRLRESYFALKRKAAPGVDGETWQQYGVGLEDRLVDLHSRLHRGAYQAKPSLRAYILKADGRQRPLGIAAVEDKVVQQAVVTILNQIYEVDFRGFSYGYRPGRSQHPALDALNVGLIRRKVSWVLDADIRSFLETAS